MTDKLYYILFLLFILACNEKNVTRPINRKCQFVDSGIVQINSNNILDRLKSHEKSIKFQTNFIEQGYELRSFLYQGKLNGSNFGLKTNCENGTIIIYAKKSNNWIVVDSINMNLGWNFKTFKIVDLNKDHFNDVVLLDFDNYRRVGFVYNSNCGVVEHDGKFDRLEK